VSIDALKAVHTRCLPGATNTRHHSQVPTERSEGGSPTERSDGGSVPPPTVPTDTGRPDSAAGDLLAALDSEAAEEEVGENHDQFQGPGGRGEP
jgi:hypothetical protein